MENSGRAVKFGWLLRRVEDKTYRSGISVNTRNGTIISSYGQKRSLWGIFHNVYHLFESDRVFVLNLCLFALVRWHVPGFYDACVQDARDKLLKGKPRIKNTHGLRDKVLQVVVAKFRDFVRREDGRTV